ncbi:MAG: hypothetical protein H0U10_01960 [Chloroflexia bacterium]|nr:hypothetical protein [Chloroflexia bacterium]
MSSQAATTARATLFPSGDSEPLAVLAAEPVVLAARYGLSFVDGSDDLDALQFAVLDLAAERSVALSKHQGDLHPGTVVRIDANADPTEARAMLAATLDLGPGDVLWWSPDS